MHLRKIVIKVIKYFNRYKSRTLLSNVEKYMLTFSTSDKKFHVFMPLCRTQCFVWDLFTLKILMWLLDLVLWLWIWWLTSKLGSVSSSILKCNNWKMWFKTWRLYWTASLRILLHLKYVLVSSLYARLFIARMALFWRTKF